MKRSKKAVVIKAVSSEYQRHALHKLEMRQKGCWGIGCSARSSEVWLDCHPAHSHNPWSGSAWVWYPQSLSSEGMPPRVGKLQNQGFTHPWSYTLPFSYAQRDRGRSWPGCLAPCVFVFLPSKCSCRMSFSICFWRAYLPIFLCISGRESPRMKSLLAVTFSGRCMKILESWRWPERPCCCPEFTKMISFELEDYQLFSTVTERCEFNHNAQEVSCLICSY